MENGKASELKSRMTRIKEYLKNAEIVLAGKRINYTFIPLAYFYRSWTDVYFSEYNTN